MTKISVIIPVYNVEQYLSESLDSVLNQSFSDFEAICINDGSTDKSLEILETYAKKDNRIKIFSQENQGQASARNQGLETAQGEYIYFLDSDDCLHPYALQAFYTTAQKTQQEIIVCDKYTSDKNDFNQELKLDYKIFNHPLKDMLNLSMGNSSVWNKLYKTTLLKNHRFIEGIYFEDWPFITTLFGKTKSYALINEPLYFYNQENVSTMRSAFSEQKIKSYLVGINNVYNFYKDSPDLTFARKRIIKAVKMCVNQTYKDKKNRKDLAPFLIKELSTLAKNHVFFWHKLPAKVLLRIFKMKISH